MSGIRLMFVTAVAMIAAHNHSCRFEQNLSMRKDLRPWWLKKLYLRFRYWYAEYFLRPECETLGPYHTIMKPWYVKISGNNIRIGRSFTAIGEPMDPVAPRIGAGT